MRDRGLLAGIDVGTTSVRTVLFDASGRPVAASTQRQRTASPHPGWVEQDAEELFELTLATLRTALLSPAGRRAKLRSIGVTNQRESVVSLDARSGRPLAPVVVWQDTRTAALATSLSAEGWGVRVWDAGGLPLTTYPSAPKMRWLLENSPKVAASAARGTLRFGTLDAWMLYRLMGGAAAKAPWVTDASNASRTLLFSLARGRWEPALLEHFAVDREQLPDVRPSFGTEYGRTATGLGIPAEVPLSADLGDQQSSLLGIGGGERGAAKLTLGTGAFFLAEGGPPGCGRRQGLIRTVLWRDLRGATAYGLEGGVGTTGAFLEWLCQGGLGLFRDVPELEREARSCSNPSVEAFVPALGGLFAPHWDTGARGALLGLHLSTRRNDIARAALDGIAHRIADILEAYAEAATSPPERLWADGGLSRSSFLLQRIADLSGVPVWSHPEVEGTSRGVALASGLATGIFGGLTDLPHRSGARSRPISPRTTLAERRGERARWKGHLERVRSPQSTRRALADPERTNR